MKNRSELREIIMKVIYQVNILEETNLDYDLADLIKEQLEIKNDFVNTSVDGIIEHKKEIYVNYFYLLFFLHHFYASKYSNGFTGSPSFNT